MNGIGVVAIGRNEGERLRLCLSSARGRAAAIVYVDSNSTDGSVEMARQMGVEVVQLDMSIPFTAARARNEGFKRLMQIQPDLDFVQFVDGDCEIVRNWIEKASQELGAHPDWAIVCGRRRERFPALSVYNRICDIEWDTPIGESKWCGGDALVRVEAFKKVNGYNPSVIAGEEPELCVRLRQDGWIIMRLDQDMTMHDAALTRFGQWWKRTVRSGHAYAEGAAMHGAPPERHFVKEVRSNWFWGLILPLTALALIWPTRGWSLALLLVAYDYLFVKVFIRARRGEMIMPAKWAFAWAWFTVLGKFPHVIGQIRYMLGRWSGKKSRLIEYKGPSAEIT
jgi:glycosyltransferase involved in cell wall biosynthesis